MSNKRKPALSMEEHLRLYPGIFRDGNKKLKEKGISNLIIPIHQRLSPEEMKKRLGVSDTKQQILNVAEDEMRKMFEDLKKKLAWSKR